MPKPFIFGPLSAEDNTYNLLVREAVRLGPKHSGRSIEEWGTLTSPNDSKASLTATSSLVVNFPLFTTIP